MLEEYQEVLRAQKRVYGSGSLISRLGSIINDTEKASNAYIRLIILRSQPLSIVEDSEFRAFSKFSETFSRKYMSQIILKLVDVVEWAIASDMSKYKGEIMYDGWSKCSIHYVGIYACFMKKFSVMSLGKDKRKKN